MPPVVQYAMEIADKIWEHTETARAIDVFAEYVRFYGFDSFVVCSHRANREAPEPLMISKSWPKSWCKRYLDREYFRQDPIMKYGKTHQQEVFDWRDALKNTSRHSHSHIIFSEQGYFGLKYGYSIPLILPNGDYTSVQIGGDTEVKLNEKDKTILVLASRFLIDILRIKAYGMPEFFGEDLSPREREVLVWSAYGKTTWEISETLNIAERTVICHQESARRKLGAANPTHSVALAMHRGLIQI